MIQIIILFILIGAKHLYRLKKSTTIFSPGGIVVGPAAHRDRHHDRLPLAKDY